MPQLNSVLLVVNLSVSHQFLSPLPVVLLPFAPLLPPPPTDATSAPPPRRRLPVRPFRDALFACCCRYRGSLHNQLVECCLSSAVSELVLQGQLCDRPAGQFVALLRASSLPSLYITRTCCLLLAWLLIIKRVDLILNFLGRSGQGLGGYKGSS